LREAARRTLSDCMGVRAGEVVTVVTDEVVRPVGEALTREAGELGADPVLTVMRPRRVSGEEPPEPVGALMRESEVLLLATKSSLSHTHARKAASKAGARCASMPGITEDIMIRTMAVDYRDVAARSRKLAESLAGVKYFRPRLLCRYRHVPRTGRFRQPARRRGVRGAGRGRKHGGGGIRRFVRGPGSSG
jgi:leucyl aminopeptidase (aminopeptidase T)